MFLCESTGLFGKIFHRWTGRTDRPAAPMDTVIRVLCGNGKVSFTADKKRVFGFFEIKLQNGIFYQKLTVNLKKFTTIPVLAMYFHVHNLLPQRQVRNHHVH